jgi:CheY-like chemotaxis protein
MTPLCLILSDDLLDASRVIGEGKAAGVLVVQCRDSASLLKELGRKPSLVVLDLHNPGLEVSAVVPAIRTAGAKIVGFGSHVDATRLKGARQMGCDEVLPRSAFFDELGAKLAVWVGDRSSADD